MSHRSTTRRAAATRRAPEPRGARPPQPGLPLLVLRGLVLLCVGLVLLREPLLRWAAADSLEPPLPAAVETPGPHTDRSVSGNLPVAVTLPSPAVAARSLALRVLHPPIFAALRLVALASLVIMAVELCLALLLLLLQSCVQRRVGRNVYRVRLPRQAATGGARPAATPDGDLFRAIGGALPSGGRWWGAAPWAAWTLSGRPDLPIGPGFVVAAPNAALRERISGAIINALTGLAASALIEPCDDPLDAALQPGRVVAWREWGLRLPAQYPLRLLDDIAAAPLQGALLAALRPRGGTVATEAQLVVRPSGGRHGAALNRGWRAHATALKLNLERKALYALSTDTQAIEAKLAGLPYAATLRVVVVAAGPGAAGDAGAALAAVGAALESYRARTASRLQQLAPIGGSTWTLPASTSGSLFARLRRRLCRRRLAVLRNRAPRCVALPSVLLPVRPWRDPMVLSSAELGGLWHLPTPALGQLVAWLPNRYLPAPPQAFADGDPERIVVGHSRRGDGSLAPVGLTLRDLRQIGHLTAGMGAGKSRLLANVCAQVLPHGLTLIDGKGDDRAGSLAATVRELIPLADEARLVLLDVLDADWPVGLNPLAGVDLSVPGGKDLVLMQVQAMFARIDPGTWSKAPGMQQYLLMATLLVLEGERHPTLANCKQALVDGDYRARLLGRAANIEVRTFWEITYPQLAEGQKTSRDALLRRFDLLLTAETTRYLLTQAVPSFDFLRAIEERLIVLVPLPDLTLGGMAGVVGTLVFQAFVRAAFGRAGSDQTRASYPLVVDEFQVLIGTGDAADVEAALTRLRSLGIPALYAHQALVQLGDLEPLMRINAQSRIILQTQEPDAALYARQYAASGVTASDISGQDPHAHQYARLLCAGQPTELFSMRPLPWPAPVAADVATYAGPPWQAILPADSPDPGYDRQLLRLVYGTPAGERPALAARLATSLRDGEWQQLLARWNAVRDAQRAHILRQPGSIPDRMERQRWLSRLLVARPALLAEVEYHRQRPAVATPVTRTARRAGRGSGPALHRAGLGGPTPEREPSVVAPPSFALADPDRPASPDPRPIELFAEDDDATP